MDIFGIKKILLCLAEARMLCIKWTQFFFFFYHNCNLFSLPVSSHNYFFQILFFICTSIGSHCGSDRLAM